MLYNKTLDFYKINSIDLTDKNFNININYY